MFTLPKASKNFGSLIIDAVSPHFSTSTSASKAVASAARCGRRWTRAQRTTSAAAQSQPRAELETGGEEKPLGHHWVPALNIK